ncbi:MAG: sulfotransferase domain-containing protein [Symploca sp. SIO1C4]|uniref:Sulfotransferase domain-containing protein n=1 Tax=Symploca sp. SIO1C4 TaxID=2607765 RepID=A0A6B3N9C7_9CYAN|nr:sulfotransferase domain-containing protein [Symploca sp. SIO1C4]NET07266.1 sulfotransferase domain-containing protein [Symploca sp. SIO2B6]
MTLPNFVIIGVPKSGTTSLYNNLIKHPDVFLPHQKKEINFFNRYYHRGKQWYENHFQTLAGETAIGDGSCYLSVTSLWPDVPRRLVNDLPEAKLIYMVRHPIDRLESMWCEHVRDGDRIPEFNIAVREWRPLIDSSLYWQQINQFRRYFSDEQIAIIFFEDFLADPKTVLKHCFEFLGVNPTYNIPNADKNYNPRSKMLRDGAIWFALRRTKFGLAARRLPQPVKNVFRKFLRKKMDFAPIWEETTLKWTVDLIEKDARQFLKHAGRDESFWDLGTKMIVRKLELSKNKELKKMKQKMPFVSSFHGDIELLKYNQ